MIKAFLGVGLTGGAAESVLQGGGLLLSFGRSNRRLRGPWRNSNCDEASIDGDLVEDNRGSSAFGFAPASLVHPIKVRVTAREDDQTGGSTILTPASRFCGNDALAGMNGDDCMDWGAGDHLLLGGLGADTLTGGAGWDYICGAGTGSLSYLTGTTIEGPPAPRPERKPGFSSVTDDSSSTTYSVLVGTAFAAFGDAGNVIHGGDDSGLLQGLGDNGVYFGDADDDFLHWDRVVSVGRYYTTPAWADYKDPRFIPGIVDRTYPSKSVREDNALYGRARAGNLFWALHYA